MANRICVHADWRGLCVGCSLKFGVWQDLSAELATTTRLQEPTATPGQINDCADEVSSEIELLAAGWRPHGDR